MELWLTERETDNVHVRWRILRVLHREQSRFQSIAVVETAEFGRALVLDGVLQLTLADEHIYHEMLVHPALLTHPGPERVLVIGGGDGGTVREALKHPGVKRVDLVEIDRRVVEVSRQYLPETSGALEDPRVHLHYEDGLRFVEQAAAGSFDVALIDASDPVGPATGLFTQGFYRAVARSLRRDGVMAAQSGSVLFQAEVVEGAYRQALEAFPIARTYLASVPCYSIGPWSFVVASKHFDPLSFDLKRAHALKSRYYTPEVHRAAFALPHGLQQRLRRIRLERLHQHDAEESAASKGRRSSIA